MAEVLISLAWWDYLAIFLITFFGLPHGAFDAAVGVSIGIYDNKIKKLYFLISYILLSFVVVILWYYFAELVLLVFLLASIFHFGLGDLKWENKYSYYLSGYFNGGIVILGISFFHFSEVNYIYTLLIGKQPTYIWFFLKLALIMWFIIFPFQIFFIWKNFNKNYIKNLFLTITFIFLLPPLLGFSFYFCFVHSLNHVKRIFPALRKTQSQKNIIKNFLIFTSLSWFLALIFLLYLIQLNSVIESILYLIFVGLAALTFPHMILIDIIYRPKLKI